jgi:hypothetical protein
MMWQQSRESSSGWQAIPAFISTSRAAGLNGRNSMISVAIANSAMYRFGHMFAQGNWAQAWQNAILGW